MQYGIRIFTNYIGKENDPRADIVLNNYAFPNRNTFIVFDIELLFGSKSSEY